MTGMLNRFLAGNRRALAKMITVVENDLPGKKELLAQLYKRTGRAFVVGVTGPPGAGKSSLINRLTEVIRVRGLTVGIIAVDPTSPFSGGAILGDRIRMQEHTLDKGVFFRSLATRGNLGGLTRSAKEVINVLDAFGKDVILVETVGVGQSEVDIMNISQATLVVLTPAGGDGVQAIKAGIMEIADIFVVNKSDLPQADKTVREIESMLDMVPGEGRWRPPVIATNTITGKGFDPLWQKIQEFREYQCSTGLLEQRRKERVRGDLLEIMENEIRQKVREELQKESRLDQELLQICNGLADPYTVAGRLLKGIVS